MSEHLVTLLEGDLRPRILLVGDVMLDRYIWGDVERISPEAPVPILRVERQDQRLGGAGSVASMLAALGAETSLAAVTGNDPEGHVVRQLLAEIGVDCSALLVDPKRITTVKQRLLGRTHQKHPHHMMRVDQEQTEPIGQQTRQQLLEAVAARIAQADLILISDYNKGVCAGEMIPRLVELARSAGVPIVADPIKGADYRRYAGCTCITPNRVEAGMAAGMKVITPQDGLDAAVKLLQFGVQAVLVTLDRDGMAWADCWGNQRLFPCRPREVADVTGAGDMVLSTLGYCLAIGADFPAAIEIANIAGGLEVERLGVVPLSRREIIAELTRSRPAVTDKFVSIEKLEAELQRLRRAGRRIVMTNGCFDLLHPGHVASLQAARRLGDCLVVGLNSDRSVREIKGPGRPVIDQQGRAEMLAALECVDYVVLFDEPSVAGLVARLRPDVLVKASQYEPAQVVGHEIVESYGGRVVCVPMKGDYSTSAIIDRIASISQSKRHAA